MTCVVGLETKKYGVVLGGDSWSSCDNGNMVSLKLSPADAKVFKRDGYILGSSGAGRYHNLLRFVVDLPRVPKKDLGDVAMLGFVVRKIVPAIRGACLRNGLTLRAEGHGEDADTGEVLLGLHGRLYLVQEDFSVERSRLGYCAIGSAGAPAMGALFALIEDMPSPDESHAFQGDYAKDWIKIALRAATATSCFSRPPYVILSER